MSLTPVPIEALFLEAVRQHQADHWQEAEALYRRVLAEDPSHIGAMANLADLALRHGRPHSAAELLIQALSLRVDDAELHHQLGRVMCAQGAYDDAMRCFERALELSPTLSAAAADLLQARSEQALAQDPDYSVLPDSPWTSGDSVWKEYCGSNTLFVLFAGLGVGRSPPTFVFRKFLHPYTNLDKLFVRDLSVSWYLRGLPGVSTNVATTSSWLRGQIGAHDRVVFIGTSAGASAAILYGELLGVDKVIAFAPQTVLSGRKPEELQDQRWERRLASLRTEIGESRYLDVAGLSPLQVAADIYYPEGNVLDRVHAERLNGPSVARWPQPGASHLVALDMRNNGQLRPVIERELPP